MRFRFADSPIHLPPAPLDAASGPVFTVAAIVAAAMAVFSVTVSTRQAPAAAPTFNHDVAPILYAHCATCHRPYDAAPMSLLTYQDVRPYARAIKARAVARDMPPWPADSQTGRFRNENTLTDAQVATLAAWADAGAPQGEGAPPPLPRFVEGWSARMNRPPDQVIEAPLAFDVPATGVIPVVTVWTKQPVGEDRFIEAIELRPTSRGAIHHASVFSAKLPRGVHIGKGELWPGGPVADGVALMRDGTPAQLSPAREALGKPLIFYVPSGGVLRLDKGLAKKVEADDYLLWMFHLTASGRPQPAGARLGLWFSRSEVDHEVVTWTVTDKVMVDGREVPRDAGGPVIPDIPAGEANFTVTGSMTVKEPVTMYALWPHMHARGRDMTFTVRDGKGREQTVLSVPRYKFGWQFSYELAKPLKISAGRTIQAIAHYDNSASNRENPDSAQAVTWGPQATDEMFDPFVEIVYDKRRLQELSFIGLDHPLQPDAAGAPER